MRPVTIEKQIFLAEKGRCKGNPISVRAVQKRMEYYAKDSGIPVTCHRLRHNADSSIMPTTPNVFFV
jgi:site-specific recombinase XerC